MKKIISILAVMSIMATLCVPAFAASEPTEPVIGEKSYPSAKEVSTVIPGGAREVAEEQGLSVSEFPAEPGAEEEDRISVRSGVSVSIVIPGGAREATEEQMQQAEENTKMPVTEEEDSGIMPLASWYSLSMTYYGQQTSMSCGPACVRMVLKNLTGTTYTEATIRNNTNYSSTYGTYLSDLVSYLNEKQDENEYGTYYQKSKTTMKKNLYTSIKTNSAPAIIGVRPSASDGFPYSGTGGHFLTVYAITTDKASVMVCDPWAGYIDDDDNRWYEITSNDLYDGYDDINCGYAY